jgi:single-stranded DNA-binding protein
MPGLARATLIGTIGRDGVSVRFHTTGTPVAAFMVVVTKPNPDGGKEYFTLWPVECWGKRAEAVGELEPGTLIAVEGELRRQKRGDAWEVIVATFDVVSLLPAQVGMSGSAN